MVPGLCVRPGPAPAPSPAASGERRFGLKTTGSVDAGGNPVRITQAGLTGGSQAVPDHPGTDAAAVPVAGLLRSPVRSAGRLFTPFNPSCRACSSTVANSIRWVRVLQDRAAECLGSDEGHALDSTHLLLKLFLQSAGLQDANLGSGGFRRPSLLTRPSSGTEHKLVFFIFVTLMRTCFDFTSLTQSVIHT